MNTTSISPRPNSWSSPPRAAKCGDVFGPFDTRQEGLAFAGSQDRAFDVVKLTAPVQKKQPVTVTFEHSPDNAHAVNTLARELGVSWSEGFSVGGTFVLKGRLNKERDQRFQGALRSGAMVHAPSLRERQPEALRHELRERFAAAATARGSTGAFSRTCRGSRLRSWRCCSRLLPVSSLDV